ncbi:FkbM family methyltransferase [Paenibacillus mesotrionivorans]|uniref:FkbM family methyltransferase n=1 Tax=Paenibacillus mesotrionivorans TaxID=3160968 RepID=A0ACC7P4Z5_9BACL
MNMLEVNAEDIRKRLMDEESRDIFDWRYEYYKTGNQRELHRRLLLTSEDSIIKYKQLRRDVERIRRPDTPAYPDAFDFAKNENMRTRGVILYGAGAMLSYCVNYMEFLEVPIKAICDTYKHGETYGGRQIISMDEALMLRGDAAVLITTLYAAYQHEIRRALLERSIPEDALFFMFDSVDTISFDYIRQYFPEDIMKPLPNEVFIDAGCFDGHTILAFREFTGKMGYKHIYGFEPHTESFAVTMNTLREHRVDHVTIQNKGLWNTAETLHFGEDNHNGGAGIAADGALKIETIRLDDVVDSENKVTFLKMDIEGAELNALHGASGIIRRDKPRLAICVYHKPEDILEIPSYILSLNEEYRLYLRHHSLYEWETVLYAI